MTSTVVCDYTYANWEVNALNQDACQVYAELQGVCNPSFTVAGVLAASPPYMPQNNACGCNVVAYNLMAACGWCQSEILTTWWLTESQWQGNCTAVTFDTTGIPTTVSTNNIAIPAWALILPTGITWSPNQAQLAAASASPTNSWATIYPTITADVTTPIATAVASATPSSLSQRSTSTFIYFSGDDNLSSSANNAGKSAGIAVGVILGIYALTAIAIAAIYFIRQNQRKAWYGPMGQYYANMRGGGQPLMYNANNGTPYETVKTPMSNTSGGGYSYQPPPPEQAYAGYEAGYNQQGYAPTNTNTNSMYGNANTNSMYGAPSTGAPTPGPNGPAGYRGYAEAH